VLAEAADIGDSAVGLHAQQAVEKALKAVLVLAEVELPRTHDLELLVEQTEAAGIEVPSELADVAWLTPWAGPLRYDEPMPLDRAVALTVAESACSWATGRLPAA
jgi:HEPN domain-containing protein